MTDIFIQSYIELPKISPTARGIQFPLSATDTPSTSVRGNNKGVDFLSFVWRETLFAYFSAPSSYQFTRNPKLLRGAKFTRQGIFSSISNVM